MAPFNSYKDLLMRYLIKLEPERILEFGPGGSTSVMLEYSEAEIESVEHEYRWFREAERLFLGNPRVHLHYLKDHDEYVNQPRSWGEFGLIFIDGFCDWRVDCLLMAKDVLKNGGVVILHDSERKKYDRGREPYETIVVAQGTAVLKPK